MGLSFIGIMKRLVENKEHNKDLYFFSHQNMEFGRVVSASRQIINNMPKSLFEKLERIYTILGLTTSILIDILVKFKHSVVYKILAIIKREKTNYVSVYLLVFAIVACLGTVKLLPAKDCLSTNSTLKE